MFNLDFKLQVFRFLPTELKKTAKAETQHWNWISVLIEGIVSLAFPSYRQKIIKELSWGRSKIQVEAFLRQKFNESNIHLITQIVTHGEFLVFPSSYSAQSPKVYPTGGSFIVRPSGEPINLEQTQLIVQVPSHLQQQEDLLRVYLKRFLHVSTIYKIEYTS